MWKRFCKSDLLKGAFMDEINKLKEQFNALNYTDWLKIVVILALAIFAIYRCFLPWRAEYAYREAFNAQATNNIPLAIEKYEKAVRLAPWETYYHVQLGRIYEDLANASKTKEEKIGYIKKAENIYQQCLAISPTNPWYQNRMGEVYNLYASVADTPQQAQELLKKRDDQIVFASNLDPNNALFQLSVAYLYHQRRQFDTAIKKYQHVLEIDDRMGEAYFNLADIYRQQGNEKKQIEMYELAVTKNPEFKNAHLQLGRIYEQKGQLDKAIKEFIEEIKIDKNNAVAFQVLGIALFKKGDWSNMEKVYNRLTYLDPNNPNNYLYKAQAQVRMGKMAEALQSMEGAAALNPNDARLKSQLDQLRNVVYAPKTKKLPLGPVAAPAAQPDNLPGAQ
jgi:tetratricopeptide (TPR) repeat protein